MAEARTLGIALGSNLGNRIVHLRSAVEGILVFCRDNSVSTSSVYQTEPVDCPEGSDFFYNAVVEVRCDLPASEALLKCQAIERKLGRPANRKTNEPRPIDLDLLYYGDEKINDSDLVLPHPLIKTRRFVLEPLTEIRPGLILPGEQQSVEEILEDFESDEPPLIRIYEAGLWL